MVLTGVRTLRFQGPMSVHVLYTEEITRSEEREGANGSGNEVSGENEDRNGDGDEDGAGT